MPFRLSRSGKSIFSRVPAIDLESARDEVAYSLDLDLDDEEGRLSDRRADGGDGEAREQRRRRQQEGQAGQALLFESDSDGDSR
jgi:hypothetical protein